MDGARVLYMMRINQHGVNKGEGYVAQEGQSARRPRPDNWGSMTKAQRERWRQNANKKAKGKRR